MKKLTNTLALAAIALTLSLSSAQASLLPVLAPKTFNVGMYRIVNTMKVNVLVEKLEGTSLVIRLKNAEGETVYTEFANKKSKNFSKRFDLEGLTDGTYTFEITDGKQTISKEFKLKTTAPKPADFRSIEMN